MATGNLPPVAKNGVQNGSADISGIISANVIDRSCTGSDSIAVASSETTDGCKVEVVGKDQGEIASSFPNIGPSTSAPPDTSADSEVVRYEEQSFQRNPVQNDPNIEAMFDKSRTIDEIYQYRVIETPIRSDIPEFGTLYYEPPLPLDSHLQSIYHCSKNSPKLSPFGFITSPSVSSSSLYTQTPESILKIAAKSFPNTPSILRKRKTENQSSTPSREVGKAEEGIKDGLLASDESKQINSFQRSEMQDRSLHGSPYNDINRQCDAKSFNASPPYRLRTKRTIVLKSVEKQLKFVFNEEQCDNDTDRGSPTMKEVSPAKNNLEMTKMGVT